MKLTLIHGLQARLNKMLHPQQVLREFTTDWWLPLPCLTWFTLFLMTSEVSTIFCLQYQNETTTDMFIESCVNLIIARINIIFVVSMPFSMTFEWIFFVQFCGCSCLWGVKYTHNVFFFSNSTFFRRRKRRRQQRNKRWFDMHTDKQFPNTYSIFDIIGCFLHIFSLTIFQPIFRAYVYRQIFQQQQQQNSRRTSPSKWHELVLLSTRCRRIRKIEILWLCVCV